METVPVGIGDDDLVKRMEALEERHGVTIVQHMGLFGECRDGLALQRGDDVLVMIPFDEDEDDREAAVRQLLTAWDKTSRSLTN